MIRRAPAGAWVLGGVAALLVLVVWSTVGESAVHVGQGWTPGLRQPEEESEEATGIPDLFDDVAAPPLVRALLSVLFLVLLLVMGSLSLLGLLAIVFGMHRQGRRRIRDVGVVPRDALEEEDPGEVLRGAARRALTGLRERAEGSDPSDAVVRAWQTLERAGADLGTRRAAHQTPTEYTASVLTELRVDGDTLDQLCRLYQRARFSSRPVTEDDVRRATAALERIVGTLERAGT
ncbi:MAG TPA: DUF4129 domain-containing protein [Pseudonocardiaceae bacterium]